MMNLITVTYNADKWQLVPREPSITMQKMAEDLYGSITYRGGYRLRDVYQTMLAAAPQPETAETVSDGLLPIQPLTFDKHGVIRFEANPLVRHLLDDGPFDMNHLRVWCFKNNIDNKYQEQFAQLIGYSLSGFGDLSYVSDLTYERAYASKPPKPEQGK